MSDERAEFFPDAGCMWEEGEGAIVFQRQDDGGILAACLVPDSAPEGAALQIARALNNLPKAEALLVEIAGVIRAEQLRLEEAQNRTLAPGENPPDELGTTIVDMANKIEEFVVNA